MLAVAVDDALVLVLAKDVLLDRLLDVIPIQSSHVVVVVVLLDSVVLVTLAVVADHLAVLVYASKAVAVT